MNAPSCFGVLLHRAAAISLVTTTGLALLVASCSQPGKQTDQATTDGSRSSAMPDLVAIAPTELPGLHNVVRYTDQVLSGAVPVGTEGFASLASMGVRTIISVDGATPQVDLAQRHGLRYVHLPISYDGVPEERGRELAQALRNLPGPFYMHCHHGKHRSAAATGTAAIMAGLTTVEEAIARMRVSGTSKNYPGLWASVGQASACTDLQLQANPADFPAVAKVTGMVATMAELDVVFDNLKTLEQNKWQIPADHPDLVPQNETRRTLELFVGLQRDEESRAYRGDYQQLLQGSIDNSKLLDRAVRDGDAVEARKRFLLLGKSCKACHGPYRNR